MQLETLEEIRERLNELRKDIEKEIGETDKPLHAEAAMQDFPGDTRSTTALYRKLQRAEKLLADGKLSEASEVLRQEDQAHITEEGFKELKEFAEKIDQEREKFS
jgi:RNA polymerase-binding transcription factor DksA